MRFLKTIASRAVLLAMMVVALPSLAAETNPAPDFPYRYTSFDISVAWSAVQSGDTLNVSGLIKNLRYAQIEDLDLTISLLDKERREEARGGALPIPIVVKSLDTVSFAAPLKGALLRPGSLLQFIIRYRVHEGADDDYSWMTSFIADAASGALLGQPPNPSNSW